ncbi:ATP-dependent DNA helicase II subunit 1 [Neophaeococcomyces mojaviensis]|uniref:ATP-dependent DNA helicase II subunit 1 n=1 Tax=Neophaeococcomyces mojaviensis TaxID=3383035 RepID=A0ACC3A142_9EURO|nr:ATP-dependent DNA helicase II subunit 1 [Knufia sp. JES_112]
MSELPLRTKDGDKNSDDNDEDEEEEVDEMGYKQVRDAVLFAIDVSKSMLKKPPVSESRKADSSSPLEAALKCAYHLMQQRIISAPKDLMGILLYGTETSKFYGEDETTRGGWSFPHCYLLTDLDIPEAEDVKALKSLVEDEDAEAAQELFQVSSEPVSMHTVLFCANQVFQQKASNFTSRRLFIVTDNDNPHADNRGFRSQATVRAKDLYDLGVVIELFPISSSKHTFDTKLFWDDIVYKSSPSDPDAIMYNPTVLTDLDKTQLVTGNTDGISLLQSLLSTISSRATPKRALFSAAALELAPNLRIGVKGFLLYKHQKPERSTYIYLGDEKPQIVKGQTTQYADDFDGGSRTIQKVEVKKAYTFGGEQIVFSQDEMKSLRNFGDPVIRIIGFKPVEYLPMWANFKTSTFIYPFEEDYVGSTRVFSALYQKLLKSKLMGLAWFLPRRNAVPVLAALIPTLGAESKDEKPNQAGVSATGCPQGFHLIPLPFADDIRQNPPSLHETPLRAPDELVDKMRPIIEQLNLPKGIYDPSRYPNPSLQWHYRILQALALEEDLPLTPEDKTKPKYRQIDKRIGTMAIDWGNELNKVYKEHIANNPNAANLGEKRPTGRATKTDEGVKKAKTESAALSEEEVRKMYEKGNLSKLTVTQLKDFARSKKLATDGLKAVIVERIETWFESR